MVSLGPLGRDKTKMDDGSKNSLSPKLQVEMHMAKIESDEKKKKMDHEYGLFSKFFGTNEKNVALYIVALIAILLITISFIYTILWLYWPQDNFIPKELWTLIVPVVTAMLGYVFGSNGNKSNNE